MLILDNMKIERMNHEHINELVDLEKECFSRPWSRSGFENELENDTAYFFVAVYENQIIGYIGTHIVAGECYIANIAVLPEFRRRSAASLLLKKAFEVCHEKSAEFISLEVRASNMNAINLYRKFDFKAVGERKNFYSCPTENALIMTHFFDTEI